MSTSEGEIELLKKRRWCKHEKTRSFYDTYGSPSTEGVQCRLCGACHVERSWKDHENLK